MRTPDPLTQRVAGLGRVDPALTAGLVAAARPQALAETAAATRRTPATTRRRRSRLLVALVCLGVLLAIALPAAALRFGVPESVHGFLSSSAPPQAKDELRQMIAGQARSGWRLKTITPELTTPVPGGTVALYRLAYTQGLVGLDIVDVGNTPARIAADTAGPPPLLTPGDVFDVRLAAIRFPNRDPYIFAGVMAPEVTSVEYVDPLGFTRSISSANGYMLGWLAPQPGGGYGYGELLAHDANGAEIGRIDICQTRAGEVDTRQHRLGMPDDPKTACALPRQRDG